MEKVDSVMLEQEQKQINRCKLHNVRSVFKLPASYTATGIFRCQPIQPVAASKFIQTCSIHLFIPVLR